MKLKPTKLARRTVIEEPKKETTPKKKTENKLPPDGYRPMFEPTRLLVRETEKEDGTTLKQYLDISVKRFDDDEAKPFVWIAMYQESDRYTGFLKGKTVHLPVEMLDTLIEALSEVSEECDNRGIQEQFSVSAENE